MNSPTKEKSAALIAAALTVAETYPVFPTNSKMPAISNHDLGKILGREIRKGHGGYHAATQDPVLVKKYFSHHNAAEIAVPMGEMSGLMCIDVDLYKGDDIRDWHDDNIDHFKDTLCHETRKGGRHYFFKHPGDNIKFPATLREGVDVKAAGNGFVCWPSGDGMYTVVKDCVVKDFPTELLREAMLVKGGTGDMTGAAGSYNSTSDDDLVEQIVSGAELYPALRTLSYRLVTRRNNRGQVLSEAEIVTLLETIMNDSEAADAGHQRHEDWVDRFGKVGELVSSAVIKQDPGNQFSDEMIAAMTAGQSFIDINKLLQASKVDVSNAGDGNQDAIILSPFFPKAPSSIPPRQWLYGNHLIRGFVSGTIAPGGTGKSSLVIAEALAMTSGKPLLNQKVYKPLRVLYWCGEDPKEELERRFSAAIARHGLSRSDLGDRLFVLSGRDLPMKVAVHGDSGGFESTGDIERLGQVIAEQEIDVVIIDPLSSVHSVNENSNSEMNFVIDLFRSLADETAVGIDLVHHSVKQARTGPGKAMGAEQARGASSIVDAARSIRVLSHPTKEDAKQAELLNSLEESYVNVRPVKGNMSRSGTGRYMYELESFDLNNASVLYPDGDSVGVAGQEGEA
jgi:RecA-family ATPase